MLSITFYVLPSLLCILQELCKLLKVEEGRLVRLAQHFLFLIPVSPYL